MKNKKKPICNLIGMNPAFFNIEETVFLTLEIAGLYEQAKEWREKVVLCSSSDDKIELAIKYVDVR